MRLRPSDQPFNHVRFEATRRIPARIRNQRIPRRGGKHQGNKLVGGGEGRLRDHNAIGRRVDSPLAVFVDQVETRFEG